MCVDARNDTCVGCGHRRRRRGFLHGYGAAAIGSLGPQEVVASRDAKKDRVAVVFLANPRARDNWPWTNFDAEGRRQGEFGKALGLDIVLEA